MLSKFLVRMDHYKKKNKFLAPFFKKYYSLQLQKAG